MTNNRSPLGGWFRSIGAAFLCIAGFAAIAVVGLVWGLS